MADLIKYYSRKDIQKELVKIAKNREISVMYGKGNFGKRPDILMYENDILELAKTGVTSFHASEERWKDPLRLKSGMLQRQLDDLRIGWDLVLDIDCKFLEYSKQAAMLLVEALQFSDLKTISVKFSGGTGMHIAIPFEAFPEKIHETLIKDWFPEGARIIASYLKYLLKEPLSKQILSLNTIQEISKNLEKPKEELEEKGIFNPYSLLDIDTVLISSRHMFRMPYSVNEKTSLVSIPIKIDQIKNFKPSQAKIKNVEVETSFLDFKDVIQAPQLFIQAFDWNRHTNKQGISFSKTYEPALKIAAKQDFFPPCIQSILKGMKEDGRKRAVFILINFLKSVAWPIEDIEKLLLTWNKKNYEALRDGYIISQINWHKKQSQTILPPNCDNKNYYSNLRVCKQTHFCKNLKNPVNYVTRKMRFAKEK